MKTYMGYSSVNDVLSAVQEACQSFADTRPEAVLFFSDRERFAAFSEELHKLFPRSTVIGASTYASFSPQGFCKRSLNIAALSGNIKVQAGVIREISRYPMTYYYSAVTEALHGLGKGNFTSQNTCCFVLNPAGTACEEMVLDTLESALEGVDIPVVGGSASSEECVNGAVSLDGDVYANSSVFTFIHLPEGRIYTHLENIYRPMGLQYTVTKSDPPARTLYELDGRPAAEVLCEALQVPFSDLAAALALHPFGRQPDDKLYIDEVERINEDRSITTYCRLLNYSKVSLLELCDFPSTMAGTVEAIHQELDTIDFSLMVNCFSRVKLYQNKGWMKPFTDTMGACLGSYLGFTSHGEQLGSFNINLTLLVLSLGTARHEG